MALHCPGCGAPAEPDATRCEFCRARLASVACPSCLAAIFAGSRFCPHCGALAARDTDDAAATGRPCPGCRTPMTAVRLATIAFDECESCDGIWLEAERFETLCGDQEAQAAVLHRLAGDQAESTQSAAPAASLRYRPCPACGKLMNRVNFARISGVVLDVCRSHGTFFDPRELERVVAFIRDGGLSRARAREREQLAEAERQLRARQLQSSMGAVTSPPPPIREHDLALSFASLLDLLQGRDR